MQQALTALTLKHTSTFHARSSAEIELRFTGGGLAQMEQTFGTGPWCFAPQNGPTLGDRLQNAFSNAFREGAQRVIAIGTDCPELDSALLASAFQELERHDVVLGPAADGGYYLVGLRADYPELFRDISWGTEHVLPQTMEKCREAGLRTARLRTLADVDHPEDLITCRRFADEFSGVLPASTPGVLSIIIPTLNESEHLERTLEGLRDRERLEIIIADGGSEDGTVDIARRLGATVVLSQRGRGRQMNAGAALARGEALLFLHADTLLPERFADQVWSILEEGAAAGAFPLRIEGAGTALRCVEWGANLRARWRQLPYGDQALFLRAPDFFRLNGFRHWPLMEDYDLSRRLRREGRIALAAAPVITSARRWRRLGVLRTLLVNQLCIAAFHAGCPPEVIARVYRCRDGKEASEGENVDPEYLLQ